MSDTLKILFPGVEKIFSENPENKLKGEISFPQIQNLDASITALDEGLTPEELQFFFMGNRNYGEKMYRQNLDDGNTKFAGFFEKPICQDLMRRYIMLIHIDTENTFFDKKNSGERIYNFFSTQQD